MNKEVKKKNTIDHKTEIQLSDEIREFAALNLKREFTTLSQMLKSFVIA